MKLFKHLIKPVYAHCDIPCGIYETDTMRHAADTCKRMIEKMTELEKGRAEDPVSENNYVRMIMIKEKHAQLCKDQIYILWSDYLKPEHIEKYPDLHSKFWKAAKQCSEVKQTVSMEACESLIEQIHDISHIFEETKK